MRELRLLSIIFACVIGPGCEAGDSEPSTAVEGTAEPDNMASSTDRNAEQEEADSASNRLSNGPFEDGLDEREALPEVARDDSGQELNEADEQNFQDDGTQAEPTDVIPREDWGFTLCNEVETRGFSVGDIMGPLDFKSCNGDKFSTEDLCGASVTWIYIVHAWCGECRKLSELMEGIAADYKEAGVATVQLLVHSYSHQLPNADDCTAWAEEFALEDTIMLFDPLVKNIMLQESQQTGLSVFLDGNQRIIAKEHFYDEESVRARIDELLNAERRTP